jgi:CRISPR/Cas system CSM-associated protein Csm3 (group 7 of RAMP superfamily)
MRFTIIFHGPFRVAAGASSDGLDATYDAANPLPSSSLKGIMRATAAHVLDTDPAVVAEIFGSAARPSPWWWSDAVIDPGPPERAGLDRVRAEVQIDPVTFTAADKTVRTSAELWPVSARFEVRRRGHVPAGRLEVHEAVLAASARAIAALGSDRRRGLGWVSVIPEQPWDDTRHQLVVSCRGSRA